MHRIQVHLTDFQSAALKLIARRRRTSMADLIRSAIDEFFRRDSCIEPAAVLDATFGALPNLAAPSRSEWTKQDRPPA